MKSGIYEAIPNADLWIVPNAGHDLLAQSAHWSSSQVATGAEFLANWAGDLMRDLGSARWALYR